MELLPLGGGTSSSSRPHLRAQPQRFARPRLRLHSVLGPPILPFGAAGGAVALAQGAVCANALARLRRSPAAPRAPRAPRRSENDPVAFCPSYAPEADEDYWGYPQYDFLNSEAWDMDGYVALLQEAADGGDWHHASSLLEEMRSQGIKPDVTCFSLALRACRHGGGGTKASELIEEMWKKELLPTAGCFAEAIAACREADAEEAAEHLLAELRSIGPAPEVQRFMMVPKIGWTKEVATMGCGAHNSIAWEGKGQLPYTHQPCWLIPCQDEAAVAIAENAQELRRRGWKLLTCDPQVVDVLRNKGKLRQLAAELGLLSLLPEHYDFFSEAKYPCILKPALGTFGKNTHIVESKDQAMRLAPEGLEDHWLLQEMIRGDLEYSTTLLVNQAEILDWAGIKYRYSMEAYVWPHVRLVEQELCSVPVEHLNIFRKFLKGFSGICNFNFKLREDGSICIFEVNPRVGGDLSFDIPKPRARALLEKMDAIFS